MAIRRQPYEYTGIDEATREMHDRFFFDHGYDVNDSIAARNLRDIEAGRIYYSDAKDGGKITKRQKLQEIEEWIIKKRQELLDALWYPEQRAKHEAPECRATLQRYKKLREQRKRELRNTRLAPSEDEHTDTEASVAPQPRKRVILVDSEQDLFSYKMRQPASKTNRTRIRSPSTQEDESEQDSEDGLIYN